jgi:hypothetical protein
VYQQLDLRTGGTRPLPRELRFDEPDQDVEGGGGRVGRQRAGRHAVEVEVAGDQQAGGE